MLTKGNCMCYEYKCCFVLSFVLESYAPVCRYLDGKRLRVPTASKAVDLNKKIFSRWRCLIASRYVCPDASKRTKIQSNVACIFQIIVNSKTVDDNFYSCCFIYVGDLYNR